MHWPAGSLAFGAADGYEMGMVRCPEVSPVADEIKAFRAVTARMKGFGVSQSHYAIRAPVLCVRPAWQKSTRCIGGHNPRNEKGAKAGMKGHTFR